MVELAAVTFGFLTNFVLISIHRNNRDRRPCPAVMVYLGYFLVGVCAATSALLLGSVLYTLALGTDTVMTAAPII
jgi:hypothetical protein